MLLASRVGRSDRTRRYFTVVRRCDYALKLQLPKVFKLKWMLQSYMLIQTTIATIALTTFLNRTLISSLDTLRSPSTPLLHLSFTDLHSSLFLLRRLLRPQVPPMLGHPLQLVLSLLYLLKQ